MALLLVLAAMVGSAAAECANAPRVAFGTLQTCKLPLRVGETCVVNCKR